MGASGWRPPQWGVSQPLWSFTVAAPNTVVSGLPGSSTSGQLPTVSSQPQTTTYFFDGVMNSEHYTVRVFTKYPIQIGASTTYHSYQMQDRVILQVGFWDTMQSYVNGQYSSSINAYQTFVALQKSGIPGALATRLQQYPTMGIVEIRATDNYLTDSAAKMAIIFEQLIISGQSTTPVVSSRPNQSQTTQSGSQQSTPVPQVLTETYSPGGAGGSWDAPNPAWSSNPGLGGLSFPTGPPHGP